MICYSLHKYLSSYFLPFSFGIDRGNLHLVDGVGIMNAFVTTIRKIVNTSIVPMYDYQCARLVHFYLHQKKFKFFFLFPKTHSEIQTDRFLPFFDILSLNLANTMEDFDRCFLPIFLTSAFLPVKVFTESTSIAI
jgi:hypothetical protein